MKVVGKEGGKGVRLLIAFKGVRWGGPGRGERGILHGVEGGVEDVGGVPVAWHILSVTNLPPKKILNLLLPCMSNSSHFHIIWKTKQQPFLEVKHTRDAQLLYTSPPIETFYL